MYADLCICIHLHSSYSIPLHSHFPSFLYIAFKLFIKHGYQTLALSHICFAASKCILGSSATHHSLLLSLLKSILTLHFWACCYLTYCFHPRVLLQLFTIIIQSYNYPSNVNILASLIDRFHGRLFQGVTFGVLRIANMFTERLKSVTVSKCKCAVDHVDDTQLISVEAISPRVSIKRLSYCIRRTSARPRMDRS